MLKQGSVRGEHIVDRDDYDAAIVNWIRGISRVSMAILGLQLTPIQMSLVKNWREDSS